MTRQMAVLHAGDFLATVTPVTASAVLGSCVAVCLHSPRYRAGAMNHFALPCRPPAGGPPLDPRSAEAMRYGDVAIDRIYFELCTLLGGRPRDLVAKITGAGAPGPTNAAGTEVGIQNIEIAKKVLSALRIPIVGSDLGGDFGRKVEFETDTGRLRIAILDNQSSPAPKPAQPDRVPSAIGLAGTSSAVVKAAPSAVAGAGTQAPVSAGVTAKPRGKPRIMIVDDAKTVRLLLRKIIEDSGEFNVVAEAVDGKDALEQLSKCQPDVITLDIHMPNMNGLEFLERAFKVRTIPTIMVTSVSREDGDHVFRSLELGAIDYIQKPTAANLAEVADTIRAKIHAAATAKIRRQSLPRRAVKSGASLNRSILVAIGASTGGTEAIREVLQGLPADIPPIVITQHIPAHFSAAFAKRLNELCPFAVKEAEDGDKIEAGRVLIAPGGLQMRVVARNQGLYVQVADGAKVSGHKPSVDALFDSVADQVGRRAIGVLLTGMGADGAQGLLKMRQRGARTIAQDEATCVVFGMPRRAIELNAAESICGLDDVAAQVLTWLSLEAKAS